MKKKYFGVRIINIIIINTMIISSNIKRIKYGIISPNINNFKSCFTLLIIDLNTT